MKERNGNIYAHKRPRDVSCVNYDERFNLYTDNKFLYYKSFLTYCRKLATLFSDLLIQILLSFKRLDSVNVQNILMDKAFPFRQGPGKGCTPRGYHLGSLLWYKYPWLILQFEPMTNRSYWPLLQDFKGRFRILKEYENFCEPLVSVRSRVYCLRAGIKWKAERKIERERVRVENVRVKKMLKNPCP